MSDIFVCDNIDDETLVYSGPVIDGKSHFVTNTIMFPGIKFRPCDIFPLQKIRLCDACVNCPRNVKEILYNNYTSTVLEEIILPNDVNFHNSFLSSKRMSMCWWQLYLKHYEHTNIIRLVLIIASMVINHNMSSFMKPNLRTEILQKLTDINIVRLLVEMVQVIYSELKCLVVHQTIIP